MRGYRKMTTNKEALREFLQNNTRYGLFEDEPFYIVESWEDVRRINSFFPMLNNRNDKNDEYPDICKVLGYLDSNLPYPMTSEYIRSIQEAINTQEAINNGQMSFISWEWPYEFTLEQARESIAKYNEDDTLSDEDRLYWINDYILDLIPSVEWGFSDEYTTCSNCGNIIKTSPDCYAWQPDYTEDDYGYLCKDCSDIEDSIAKTQDKIDRNKTPNSLLSFFELPDEFTRIPNPYDRGEYKSCWENGLHHGMNDDPLRQGKIIRNVKLDNTPIYEVVYRIYPSQFYVEWDTYIRVNPSLDDKQKEFITTRIPEDLKVFSELFDSSEGRYPYDIASLYETALQNIKTNFTHISVNPDEGTYKLDGTNDINEFFTPD